MRGLLAFVLLLAWAARAAADSPLGRWAYLKSGAAADDFVLRRLPEYDALVFTGYQLKKNGSLRRVEKVPKRIWEYCREYGILLIPLVAPESVSSAGALLRSPAARARAARELVHLSAEEWASGVQLDIEYLPPRDAALLAAFLKELKAAWGSKPLSMALFPQLDFKREWAGFHALGLIAPYLDEAVLMGYDYHNQETPPGPVVDIVWAERNIKVFLEHFRPEQLRLGIPAYGYVWGGQRPRSIAARLAVNATEERPPLRHASGTAHYWYREGDKKYQVYYSDRATRAALRRLAEEYGLAGTVVWRLEYLD